MNERQNDPPDRAVKLGFGDWSGPPLNASERTPELMKFLRLAWWVSRDGPQLDRTRSDTGMISKNFNSYASLAIFFIISVFFLFCFWTRNFIHWVWNLQNLDCTFRFLFEDFCLCSRYNKLNYGAWHVYNLCLVLLLLLAGSLVPKFHFQSTKKS